MKKLLIPLLMAAAVGSACAATPAAAPAIPATAQQLTSMSARYAPVALTADVTHLSAGDRQAIAKLVEELPQDWLAQARALEVVAIHCDHAPLTREQVAAIKAQGYGVFCYTVNTQARADELLGWGVDGFCTDRIDIIPPVPVMA